MSSGPSVGKVASMLVAIVALLVSACGGPAAPEPVAVTLAPSKDNTIFADDTRQENSNARGAHIFFGDTARGFARRTLLAFDLSDIPAGATIVSVELHLTASRVATPDEVEVTLHRLIADWGEGESRAFGPEGGGTLASEGDATWIHRFHETEEWASPGGDFLETPSAMAVVSRLDGYTWGPTPEMIGDVQAWLDSPEDNFGWLLKTAGGGHRTAKRFDSRENPDETRRPRLVVQFVVPAS